MDFFINYWHIIMAVAALPAVAVLFVCRCFGLPRDAQLDKVREWLLWAVTEAEKNLGGGTGKLKLRQVYDLFVTRFPWLARIVPFDLFSSLVDDALEDMRDMLKTNQAVKAHVNGEGVSDE